ncbi:hypothetical protein [Lewinella sp. 4G2]|uniref:WD40/YVTN/BNR-like repeat-containing protein n=1 Tax=Lewinella sp. 4G2 TaxID=1803372 RepID=UPI0007B46129|nr:hypothetical protein [Lewinella sp. 4G2]OAV42743.1 hypothetical protein A3850_016005 [Lewinella sp. 4G2]
MCRSLPLVLFLLFTTSLLAQQARLTIDDLLADNPMDALNRPISELVMPGALFLSSDQGKTWTDFTDGLPADALSLQLLDHEGDLFLTTSMHGLFTLPENECEWRPIGEGLPDPRHFTYGAMEAHGDHMVMATFQHGIFISDDRGAHWRRPVLNISNQQVMCLEFHDGVLYAGTGAGIWQSHDYGRNWQFNGGEMFPVYGLLSHNGRLVVAQQNGLGVVNGKDISWSPVTTQTAVTQLLPAGDFVYAVTASHEVFRSENGGAWATPDDNSSTQADPDPMTRALWNGFWPALPVKLPKNYSTRLVPDARGWMALVRGGC